MSDFEASIRSHARGLKGVLAASALLSLAYAASLARALILNTDWRSVMGSELGLRMVLAMFALPLMALLYLPAYLALRGIASARSRAWSLGLLLPALAAVFAIGLAVLDRLFPERLFREFTGIDLPPSAQVIHHSYDATGFEDQFVIQFEAPDPEIEKLLRDFGKERRRTTGVEFYDPVPVLGDYGNLRIDWDRGKVRFEYLDV